MSATLHRVGTFARTRPGYASPVMRFRRSALTLSAAAAALLLSACTHSPPPTVYYRPNKELCAQQLAQGDLDRAEVDCDLGLEFAPHDPDLWALKGLIALQRQDTAQAKEHFLKAIRYAPDHQQALLNLGSALLDEGAYEPARERFRQALRSNPDSLGARYGMGLALMKLGRREEARKELRAVRDADPGNAGFHHILGRLELEERNLEGAWQHLSRATQLAPEEPLYWHDLGKVLMDQRRFGEAEAALLHCVRPQEPHADCQADLEKARHAAAAAP